MEITTDEYELPTAIADTPTELARLVHRDRTAVWKMLKRQHKRKSKYVEVEIEEDEMIDRDCENCANHAEGGCIKWDCEYIPKGEEDAEKC